LTRPAIQCRIDDSRRASDVSQPITRRIPDRPVAPEGKAIMTYRRNAGHARRALFPAVLLSLCASFGWATDTSCPVGATPINTFGTGITNGCIETDKNFLNFTAGAGPSNSVGTADPDTASIDILGGGTTALTTAQFTTPGGRGTNATWSLASGGTHTMDSQFTYTVENTSSPLIDLLQLSLGTNTITANSGNTITVTEVFCLGQTTLAGCTAAHQGTISLELTTQGGTPSETITLPTGAVNCSTATVGCIDGFGTYSTVFVQTDVILDRVNTGGGTTVALNSLTEGFGDAPEPSTFVLLGSALAGVVLLRFKKRFV